jgi:hypothetical protein
LSEWRKVTRRELGLSTDRPIIATGHQTLLWHPGILAKYLALSALAAKHTWATAHLIVDQHASPPSFGAFDIPVRGADGALAVRTIDLCRPPPRAQVPMGRHEAFTPPPSPPNLRETAALASVQAGTQAIFDRVSANRAAPNAAIQMAAALADLMRPWVAPMPHVTSTDLIRTSLGHMLLRGMIDDPRRCAESYNRAVRSMPDAGIGALLIRDDYVELPLWRLRDDGRRLHAFDNDVETALEQSSGKNDGAAPAIDLLPRALLMTALARLGMCDLFIHGKGGARYDRAMELWIKDWLGVQVGSVAVASATVRLPLISHHSEQIDLPRAVLEARRIWHDPETLHHAGEPSPMKRRMLRDIESLPRRSPQRKAAFLRMHEELGRRRQRHEVQINAARQRVERARLLARDQAIADRRDWAFPLYPRHMIDQLAAQIKEACGCESAT